MNLGVWFAQDPPGKAKSDFYKKTRGGIPSTTGQAYRGLAVMLNGDKKTGKLKVDLKVNEAVWSSDTVCTRDHDIHEPVALKISYDEGRNLAVHVQAREPGSPPGAEEWKHCGTLQEVSLPRDYTLGIASTCPSGSKYELSDLKTEPLKFRTGLGVIRPEDFGMRASLVGSYLALDLDKDGVVDNGFVEAFQLTRPHRYALARAERILMLRSMAPIDTNQDSSVTLDEFVAYFGGKTGLDLNFRMCTTKAPKSRSTDFVIPAKLPKPSRHASRDSASVHGTPYDTTDTVDKVDRLLLSVLVFSFFIMVFALLLSKRRKAQAGLTSKLLSPEAKAKGKSGTKSDAEKKAEKAKKTAAAENQKKEREEQARLEAAQAEEKKKAREAQRQKDLARQKEREEENRAKEDACAAEDVAPHSHIYAISGLRRPKYQ